MTRAEAKQRAREMWQRWQWLVAVVLLPLLLWAAKRHDASKLDTHTFDLYVQQQGAARVLHEVRDSARQADVLRQLRYLTCRADYPRRSCMEAPK